MIHQVSLAECLDQVSPPEKVLNISACDDTVFVRICEVDEDHDAERYRDVAEISVSLPALIEALNMLAVDSERERLRPFDGHAHESRLAGRRLTVAPVAPYSAVAMLTDHFRYAPKPGKPMPDDDPEENPS